MQRLGPRAYLVLERKIFKSFYHIWARLPFWSMNHAHFSNLSFSCPKKAPNEIWARLAQRLRSKSFEIINIFSVQNVWDPYKCIQKQTWPRRKKVKRQGATIILATDRPPVPDDLCKYSATRHPRFWRNRFSKVFTIYKGMAGILGQWAATILATFHSSALRRLQIKFQQYWPRGSRGEVIWNS